MNKPNFKPNTLWTGDNLPIMRGMNSACIDLVYLDPPFNSKTNYSAPIGSKAAGAAFKDMWSLSDLDVAWLGEIAEHSPALHDVIRAARSSHGRGMQSYLTMMAVRIIEIKRILKPSGSVWLHCDPTAAHHLKMLMDVVFDRKNHINDIVWQRHTGHGLRKAGFDTVSDMLLFYANDATLVAFNPIYIPLSTRALEKDYRYFDAKTGLKFGHYPLEKGANKQSAGQERMIEGRRVVSKIGWAWNQETFDKRLEANPDIIYWTRTGRPRYKKYYDPAKHPGTLMGNVWTDVPFVGARSKERTGYPTQKPLALLKRIIEASSNPGDLILDPFCGCATTLVAARNLNRKWVGIDLSELAHTLVRSRMDGRGSDTYGKIYGRTDLPVRNDVAKIPHYKLARHTLYGSQEGLCKVCKMFFEFRNMAVDHIIPVSQGGGDQLSNLQMLCGACNSMKGDRSMSWAIAQAIKRGIRRG